MKKILATIVVAVCAAFGASAAKVNLANVTANKTLANGDVAYGALAANVKVSIAAGATVTLSNAMINGVNSSAYPWAGLTCLGDAEIVLKGNSSVMGFYETQPGIFVPEGNTLTLQGDGALSARCHFDDSGLGTSFGAAAGIGGGYFIDCGNIVINGGTITANGGNNAAGIGGAHGGTCGNIVINGGTIFAYGGVSAAGIGSYCGDISIYGGTTEATGGDGGAGIGGGYNDICGDISIYGGTTVATGGQYAAGIGSGRNFSRCGTITITNGVTATTHVTATCGTGCSNPIGAGVDDSSCAGESIADSLCDDHGSPTRTIMVWDGNLATLTADATVQDGMVLHGTLAANVKVSIAAGATVTISNAVINGVDNNNYPWAGLTCLGDAEIVLKGNSSVMGFYENYPGIHVPVGSTLTIQGDGMLWVSSNGYGAGIGGGDDIPCGSIVITGGTISAPGGNKAAGIGGGRNSACGNIAISGGTIDATGGSDAAGIGSGFNGSCGTITIGMNGSVPPAIRVTATQGAVAWGSGYTVAPIGAGASGTCAGVSVASFLYDDHESPTRTIMLWDGDLATLTSDATAVDGTVIHGTLSGNYKVSIAAGATVTLSNAVINGVDSLSYMWAGITCEGDATIVLKGSSEIRGFYKYYPGIYVPEGHTLTIDGDTVFDVDGESNLYACGGGGPSDASGGGYGAGIGGGNGIACGSVWIKGGEITAEGGWYAAGIGGGSDASFGDIRIDNGIVLGIGGGNGGSGIGGGSDSYVAPEDNPYYGSITITGGSVEGIGCDSGAGIGCGREGLCGDITITGGEVYAYGGEWAPGIGSDGERNDALNMTITINRGITVVQARRGSSFDEDPIFNGVAAFSDVPPGMIDQIDQLGSGDTMRTIRPDPNYWNGILDTVTGNVTAIDGTVIRGTLGDNYKVSIADGATVTLSNAVINADGSLAGAWAGLTCEGNATIVLAAGSESVVKAFNNEYPGIFVPVDCMLTIQGTGSLTASAKSAEAMAAGIGGGCTTGFSQINCGSISIAGGTVIATGGTRSAGIGSAYRGTCGDITIGAGITRVVATRGEADGFEDQVEVIGAGLGGNRGTVTVDSSLSDDNGSPTRTITGAPPPQVWDGDLSTLTADATAQDGTVIHGELHAYVKVSIAAGARVTISNVTIEGPRSRDYQWAGLTCLGDAEIVLVGTNTVIGAYGHHPGIFVPAGSTLTISGSGVLTTSSHGQGAGIGGGYGISCGNIVINGGTITATGGDGAAGIGGGLSDGVPYAECGDITINGGTVTATGGHRAAGIGGGYAGGCSNIVVGTGISQVVATCGDDCNNPIGLGYLPLDVNACTVTVDGSLIDYTVDSTRTLMHPPVIGGYAWNFTVVDGEARIIPFGDGLPATSPAPSGNLEIPSVLGGCPVTVIGNAAFVTCGDITSVTIPDGVTTIGGDAFYACSSLATVTIPASVTTISSRAFRFTGLGTAYVGEGKTASVKAMLLSSDHDQSFVDGITFIETTFVEPWDGNLAEVYRDTTVTDDTTLYGELPGNYKISIAAGATVVLSNAVINGVNDSACPWAGLTCLGDAQIILAPNSGNVVKGFFNEYPGIYVPVGSTLTVGGSGSLNASSNGNGAGIGAGFGYRSPSGDPYPCGNIRIEGGTITATGSNRCAGIGGGNAGSTCGDIEILGGTVTATGGDYAAGIGGGDVGTCGDITIGVSVTRVVSTVGAGYGTHQPIGQGDGGTCGTITVDSSLSDTTSADGKTRTITAAPVWDGDLATLTGDVTIESDMTLHGELAGQYKISIADGVTVTLNGAVITNGMNDTYYSWAGLTCLGDAEIVLAPGSANFVKGFYADYPGIYVPENKTLTISGFGSLDASSNGDGAGIGAGYEIDCGDIVIESGTINATGGFGGAAIGGAYYANCGEVTINGGTITAIAGNQAAAIGGGRDRTCEGVTINGGTVLATGDGAAGIGTGYQGTCGAISITGGDVTATGGDFSAGIGGGNTGSCGDITITGGTVSATGQDSSAGIGGGSNGGGCGDITIGAGIVRVVATCSDSLYKPIGEGSGATEEASVTVAPGLYDDHGNPTRTITSASTPPPVWNGDLATLTGDVTVESDMTLYGTLAGQYKISIADGVTVTLDGADITCGQNGEGYAWAGLTCLGDAEIVLAAGSANFVKGFYEVYPGIFVPAGSTLTIGGSGSLDAGSNGDGAGIGGGYRMDCGSIVIEGGVITATGGYESAGIGTGSDAACGTITITGGQVTATGGSYAAGIGTGDYTSSCGAITITGGSVTATGGTKGSGIGSADDSSSCGAITIGTDIVRVVASSGSAGADPIGKGAGSQASCGTVTVDPGLTDDHGNPTRTITSASTPPPPVWNGDLATLTGNVTVESDMTIYGELAGQYKISIADGVTVTLDGAAITNGEDASGYSWAGLTCLGDAEIVLAAGSANFVKGFYKNYPGIYVPENKTLTISGSGSLDARSNGQGAGIGAGSRTACGNIVINGGRIAATGGTGAAGIGSGRSCACGNIMIAGGSVTATGGNYAAGIGTGDFTSQCGDIAIAGGSVTATGGRNGAGIGSGDDSSRCGDITIGVGIVRVVATRGGASAEPVGKGGGSQASCGTVTVDPSLSQATSADGNTRTIIGASVWDGNLATLSGDATALEGTVIHGTLSGNYKITIADGAKVTLDGATIDGEDDENYPWAGLTCLGDAEIVIAPGSENFIEGFYGDHPGIHVPAGHTLTISGSGSLDASSNGLGAGIGGGFDLPCGSIVIEGGTISATGMTGIGGSDMGPCADITINGGNVTAIAICGAGIGGGDGSSCGDIAINGGTVVAVGAVCGAGIGGGGNDSSCGTITIAGGITTATGGGSGAAGIGAGACDPELDTSTCGDITIGADIVRVVAKRGSGGNGNECIGAGEGSDPVRVTVDPGLADDHGSQTRTIAYVWDGNLATLTRNVTIASDMTIYGELAGQYKISIADGVTVILDGAVVTNGVDSSDYPWAGLTCLGDAQIVLAAGSENFVKGFYEDHPGIHVPAGSTLTISGSGSLDASSNGCGAGIGGGYQLDCGNIVINGGRIAATGGIGAAGIGSGRGCTCGSITIAGGSVTATGGDYAAGIGTGDFTSSCGDITITGGNVTATGGRNGAGIGSGDDSSRCGTITIGADIVRVEATRGDENAAPIGKGAGDEASCGTVTVDSSLTDDNGSPTRTITGGGSGSGYAAWAVANGVSGAWDAVDASGVANVFRYAFDKPTGAFTDPVLLDITFNAQGRAVILTPPLVNTTGFTFTIGASDNVDGTGNAASYPLNASGETVIDETGKTTRFFRIRAVTQ